VKRAADGLAPWLLVGIIGWVGIIWIGWMLWQSTPPRAGFDLSLLLEAARRVAAGQSPYDPAMIAGTAPNATSLFYSYPPPVAQAMTLLAWLPDGIVLVLWGIGATLGLGAVALRLAQTYERPGAARTDALKIIAAAPLVLPFAVAVLFGNLDAWYGLAFGALVLAMAAGPSTRARAIGGGIALGIVTVAKLHPGSLLVWLAARAVIDRRGPARSVLTAATVTGLVVVAASVLVGGIGPWQDYVAVLRAGAGAAMVDPRNVGPVSLLGQVVALDGTSVTLAQAVVSIAALAISVLAAVRVRDPLESVALAIAASLVVLPVTWYHYPVVLLRDHAAARPRHRPRRRRDRLLAAALARGVGPARGQLATASGIDGSAEPGCSVLSVHQEANMAGEAPSAGQRAISLILFALAVVGAMAGLFVFTLHGQGDPLNDAQAYYWAGGRLNAGLPLYPPDQSVSTPLGYPYPPMVAILWRPLALLPWPVAAAIWEAVIVAAFLATIWWLGPRRRATWLAIGILALPIGWCVAIGQVQVILTLLSVIGTPWSVALAANIKLFPALLALWWLGRGDWRRLGQFIGWMAALALIQLVLAPQASLDYVGSISLHQVGAPGAIRNISPYAISPLLWAALAVGGGVIVLRLARTRWGWAAAATFAVVANPRLIVYLLMALLAAIASPGRRPSPAVRRP
jgi:hypothetical protein